MVKHAGLLAALCAVVGTVALAEAPDLGKSGPAAAEAGAAGEEAGKPVEWEGWRAHNAVDDRASLQRGARNFMNYCSGCHSLKYMRYSRLANDLQITPEQLQKYLLPAGAKASDYITSPMPAADAQTWFGKVPPDLSLMARERGDDYLYRFLTTFFSDPSRTTGANNLQLATTAMPDVLSTLEGVKVAVFRTEDRQQVFDHFVQVAPGSLSRAEYLGTVRDIVNFLDYVGEPAQVQRRSLGVKVVLFLLAFTALTYLLKREYWKNIH